MMFHNACQLRRKAVEVKRKSFTGETVPTINPYKDHLCTE
jgi:hypothetical protein